MYANGARDSNANATMTDDDNSFCSDDKMSITDQIKLNDCFQVCATKTCMRGLQYPDVRYCTAQQQHSRSVDQQPKPKK
jgi:hypothetical protein